MESSLDSMACFIDKAVLAEVSYQLSYLIDKLRMVRVEWVRTVSGNIAELGGNPKDGAQELQGG